MSRQATCNLPKSSLQSRKRKKKKTYPRSLASEEYHTLIPSNIPSNLKLFISDLLSPSRRPKPDSQMRHNTLLTCPMPVRRPRRCPNQISSSDLPRRGPFITDPSFAVQNLKVLAFFVRVPVGAGTWGKCNVTISIAEIVH